MPDASSLPPPTQLPAPPNQIYADPNTPPAAAGTLVNPMESLPTLQKWFGDEIVYWWGDAPTHEQRWLTVGCIAWGDYVDTMIGWSLATMLTPENLEALAPCWLLVYTDAIGYAKLLGATQKFDQLGITPIIRLIPDNVLIEITRTHSNRYWGLGTAHNMMVRAAHRMRTGFHMSAPDHLYGQRWFKSMRRLAEQHHVISQTGVSCNFEGALRDLMPFRHPRGWLAVPDIELGTVAWRHLHAQTRGYLMNEATVPDRMPPAHFLVWQGEDALHTYCCHQNAAWLSPQVCHDAPNFLPATIDTRLPHFTKDFYVPTIADEMTFIEVSHPDKLAVRHLVDREAFAARCWSQTGFSLKYFPYFMQPSLTPTHLQSNGMSREAIKEQHQQVADYLWSVRPPSWMATLQEQHAPVA